MSIREERDRRGLKKALPAGLLLLLFLSFIFAVSPAFSEDNSTQKGVLNVPPKIVEIFSTASSAGAETLFTITVFDGNSGYDVCSKGAPCNATCAFAELFSASASREELECDDLSCKVFGQFSATDHSPSWDPKTSQLVARVPFSPEAKLGRWSCDISVSDDFGESDTKSYSIYLRPESGSVRFLNAYQRIFFSAIVPAIALLAIAYQFFRLASRKLSQVDWEGEADRYIEAKAHIDFIEASLETELEMKKAERISALLRGAREVLRKGDYSGALWLCKSIEGELGDDHARVHIPRRLLSFQEKMSIFSAALLGK